MWQHHFFQYRPVASEMLTLVVMDWQQENECWVKRGWGKGALRDVDTMSVLTPTATKQIASAVVTCNVRIL
jgi:hypothetical protein